MLNHPIGPSITNHITRLSGYYVPPRTAVHIPLTKISINSIHKLLHYRKFHNLQHIQHTTSLYTKGETERENIPTKV